MIGKTYRIIKWTQRPSSKNLPNDKNSSALYGKTKAVYCESCKKRFKDDFDNVAEAQVNERGRFEISLPDGEFLVSI